MRRGARVPLFPGVVVACLACASPGGQRPRPALPPAPATIGLARDPALAQTLASVSATRIRSTDSVLVSFGTRHAMSDTASATRGKGAAYRWIRAQLEGASRACGGCLHVEYDTSNTMIERHPELPPVRVVNVLAWLPGRDTGRVIVMGGHYDSCICSAPRGADGRDRRFDAASDAPGADDDGSGTSAVLELARVFAEHYPHGLDATVVFALYDGEELGLFGSRALAARLHRQGVHVVAGMTDDIVGNVVADDDRTDDTSVRIFGADPDNGSSRELARYVWALGALYQPDFAVLPVFRLDRIGRGGDHRPFVDLGDAGLRFTERLENYKRQHLPTDDFAHVDFDYVARVARLNAATVGSLGLAPRTPDSVTAHRDAASGGQKWRLSWKPVPGAAGYEVLVRHTYAPTYERVIPVGNVTDYLLGEQLDDGWAAVRSVDAEGHRSLTTVVPPPPSAPPRASVPR